MPDSSIFFNEYRDHCTQPSYLSTLSIYHSMIVYVYTRHSALERNLEYARQHYQQKGRKKQKKCSTNTSEITKKNDGADTHFIPTTTPPEHPLFFGSGPETSSSWKESEESEPEQRTEPKMEKMQPNQAARIDRLLSLPHMTSTCLQTDIWVRVISLYHEYKILQ